MIDNFENILDHYHNPRNFFIPDKFTNFAKTSNLSCGDEIEVYLILKADCIIECSFQAEGCSIAIAAGSIYLEYLKGKSVIHVKNLSFDDFLNLIDIPLTISRQKCASLVFEAVKKAIE